MRYGWMPGSKPGHDESCRLGARLFGRRDRARCLDLCDLAVRIAEHLGENLLRVLAEQRRALHVADAVRHLDRVADRQILAALRMIDLDHGAGLPQRWLLG